MFKPLLLNADFSWNSEFTVIINSACDRKTSPEQGGDVRFRNRSRGKRQNFCTKV